MPVNLLPDVMNPDRARHLTAIFPAGVPSLWCPPITHYRPDGTLDHERIAAHYRFLAPHVQGVLVPGTTGDGWELSPAETRELIRAVLDLVPQLGIHLLWGALHPDATEARRIIESAITLLCERTGATSSGDALARAQVCGFAVCPPRGADRPQSELESELAGILELGVPLALYQLPQVTQNEISPETTARLAERFANFILFKDTSGSDRVTTSGVDLQGVVLVRGMEGAYASWLKSGGGAYDGFLLCSANSFAAELDQIRRLLELGERGEAGGLSDRLTRVVEELFAIVAPAQGGNAFANAGKLADHYFAHGPAAASVPPPRLHSGPHLTADMVEAAGSTLARHGFLPRQGYLQAIETVKEPV